MDFVKIKNLVKNNGDKFIMVENGEPELVVMSFKEYEKIANGGYKLALTQERPRYENEIISGDEELKETEFVTSIVAGSSNLPIRLEDIKLEDLPI